MSTHECLSIGASPWGESCAQIGSPDYPERSRRECLVLRRMLLRQYPVPQGVEARLITKSFPHEFGEYREVCVVFDPSSAPSANYAYSLEQNVPEHWDAQARHELAWHERKTDLRRALRGGEIKTLPKSYRAPNPPRLPNVSPNQGAPDRVAADQPVVSSVCDRTNAVAPSDERDKETIEAALHILESRMRQSEASFRRPEEVRSWLRLKFSGFQREAFGVLYLDCQQQLIAFEIVFVGTLAQCSVHPREIVKAALLHNAGAVILAHNHPSWQAEPSSADEVLTRSIRSALGLIDVKVLDHFVVTDQAVASFAERGWI